MGAEIGLFALCLFLFFWRLGSVPLFDYDEALYVTCAQQMVLSGDWVTPRLNTRMPERPGVTRTAFFEKPIMVYWASAGSMRLFGRNMWAARLPVALVALLTTLVIYWAGRHWFGRRAGLLAALVYVTAPMTLVDARQMTTDGLLVLWLTVALLCFWQAWEGKGKGEKAIQGEGKREKGKEGHSLLFPIPYSLFPALFWLMCGLAVLTKGIVGLLLPFMIVTVYLLLDRVFLRVRLRTPHGPRVRFALQLRPLRVLWSGLARLRPVSGVLLFLLVAAPWHVLIARGTDLDAQGRTWVQEYLLRQHIGRFKGLDTVHNQPLPTYLAYFLIGFFPWACFVPAAFRLRERRFHHRDTETQRVYREDHTEVKKAGALLTLPNGNDEREGAAGSAPAFFLLVWFWTIFVFFSIGAAKLPTYITPAYPAAALLVGRWLDGALKRAEKWKVQDDELDSGRMGDWERRGVSLRRGAAFACGTGLLILIVALAVPPRIPASAYVPPGLIQLALHVALLFTLGSGAAYACFRFAEGKERGRAWGVGVLALMMVLVLGVGGVEGYAVVREAVLGPYQQLALAARSDVGAGIPIVYYHIVPRRPSMLFYGEYSPFEHKEAPLLPFLAACLTPTQREADIITNGQTYTRLLVPEINALPGATVRLLEKRGPADGWILARVSVPTSYKPPPVVKPKQTLWTPVTY